MLLNVHGLISLSNKSKLLRINDIACVHNIKVIGITESHLDDKHQDGEVSINGFRAIRSDRRNRKHGGVMIYTANEYKVRVIYSDSNEVCETLVLYIRNINSIVAICYRPPDCTTDEFSEIMVNVDKAIEKRNE